MGELITVPVEGTPNVASYNHPVGLKVAQQLVQGYVEVLPGFTEFKGQPAMAIVNEEGAINGMPLNPNASLITLQVVHGPMIILTGEAMWKD